MEVLEEKTPFFEVKKEGNSYKIVINNLKFKTKKEAINYANAMKCKLYE